jgi:hypothetical protein
MFNLFCSALVDFGPTVVVLCAAPKKIKEIMLAAEELNMVASGEYVFFNIELFNR